LGFESNGAAGHAGRLARLDGRDAPTDVADAPAAIAARLPGHLAGRKTGRLAGAAPNGAMHPTAVRRVFTADGEGHVRSALRLVLSQEPDLRIVGEASQAEGLAGRVGAAEAELVLLDWGLAGPGDNGVVAALRDLHPRPLVIALSGRPEHRFEALAAGVDAFVSKGDPPERLLAVVRAMIAGADDV
jgi:CheY-like chemotaxis protein